MFNIKIAGIVVCIDNKHSFIEKISKDYLVHDCNSDFTVSVSDNDINEECKFNKALSEAFIESVCIYRKIAEELPKYDAFVLHGASIEYNGSGFCFLAKSGTGKTTHTRLWRNMLGKEVLPINGDKPIIRLIDNVFYVCGTPWGGKEMLQRNVMIPLKALCELSQAKENSIDKLDKQNALNSLISHIFIPNDKALFERTILLSANIIASVPMWHLKCNISEDAAKLSFNAMNSKE